MSQPYAPEPSFTADQPTVLVVPLLPDQAPVGAPVDESVAAAPVVSVIEVVTLEAEVVDDVATRQIAKAVSARHTIARKYVMWLRRRHPDATPAEVIRMLERHYANSISTAGAMIVAGSIAADVGIALIPGVGAVAAGAKSAGQQGAKKAVKRAGKEAAKAAAKQAAKNAAKQAAKNMALSGARTSAQRVAALLPAGDEQMQFEITAIFGLSLADIHGMDLDEEQAMALVYGLSNQGVSQQQIATMAADVATMSSGGVVGVGQNIAAGRGNWSHWASTLAESLPAGSAQSLVRTMQTGELDLVREGLSGKQQTAIEYGVGAVAGGVTRFVFGRDVIDASRGAFPAAPDEFPAHLSVPVKGTPDGDEAEPNAAVAALKDAAQTTGGWITGTAGTVGSGVASGATVMGAGVASAAGTVSRPFRSVDIDGDGIPDEARALTAVKGVGGSIAGAADTVGGSIAGLFKSRKRGRE